MTLRELSADERNTTRCSFEEAHSGTLGNCGNPAIVEVLSREGGCLCAEHAQYVRALTGSSVTTLYPKPVRHLPGRQSEQALREIAERYEERRTA